MEEAEKKKKNGSLKYTTLLTSDRRTTACWPKNMQIVLVKRHIFCLHFVVASLIFSFNSIELDFLYATAPFSACIVFIWALEPPSIIELHFHSKCRLQWHCSISAGFHFNGLPKCLRCIAILNASFIFSSFAVEISIFWHCCCCSPKKTFSIKPGKFILYYVEPSVCAETACDCVGTHKRVENSVNFQRKFSLAAYFCICKNSIAWEYLIE